MWSTLFSQFDGLLSINTDGYWNLTVQALFLREYQMSSKAAWGIALA